MLKKASFQRLKFETSDVYRVYNPSPEEITSINSHFNKVTPIDSSNYLVSASTWRHISLELFVHDYWIVVKFNLTPFFKEHGLNIPSSEVKRITETLRDEHLVLHVNRDVLSNTWSIHKQDELILLEKIKNILK